MASQVAAQCIVEQETGFLVDIKGNKLQAKPIVLCQGTPYMVTGEGGINHFMGCKMDNVYHKDKRYFDFLENQVKELKSEKNQSILSSMF